MIRYAKLNDNGGVRSTCVDENNAVAIAKLEEDGFLPHVIFEATTPLTGYQGYEAAHKEVSGTIVTTYEVVENCTGLINKQIKQLKAQIAATDYKVTKNHELMAIGREPAYDPMALYNERQPIRDKINELEELLKQ